MTAADDVAIADLESELKMKRDVRDDKYVGRGRQTLKGRPRRRRRSSLRQRQPALRRHGLRP